MICLTCNGTGVIITCCDDLCANSDHCIHGDGEEMCPDCEGEGEISGEDDDYPMDFDDDLERVCPYCNGTTLSPYPDDGGSCPHCFGGKIR